MPVSTQTHHALKVIRDYLEGENEAVQYELEFMADQVTQSSSGMIGGFQAGNRADQRRRHGQRSPGVRAQRIPQRLAHRLCVAQPQRRCS